MRPLLNTIAVEPNRWAKDRGPAYHLERDLLPRIREAGFRHVEVWQHHVSCLTLDEVKSLRAAGERLGVDFPVVGAYPAFHLAGAEADTARAEMFTLAERAALLGARWVKFFFGRKRAADLTAEQLALTTQRAGEWFAYGHERGLGFCAELHGYTLFDPYEFGRSVLRAHPEWQVHICFQPYGGAAKSGVTGLAAPDDALRLIGDLGPLIVHAHFSGGNEKGRCLLRASAEFWRPVARALQQANPRFLPSIEFVPRGFPAPGQPFDLAGALADAADDARFLDEVLAS